MIVLDENVLDSQRLLLRGWHIRARQIGHETGRKGMQDEEIIPLLMRLRRPTFFTLDSDSYKRTLCHRRYCLVCLDVGQYEVAYFTRRLLAHQEFNTEAKRMDCVLRVSHTNIALWRAHIERESFLDWD
jgi:hypothetical protein